MSLKYSLFLAGVCLGATLWPASAVADIAAAEALFNEGRKLMADGKLDQACPKLAESHRLDPSPATLGSLAQCHEKQGKTASAWAEYLASARLADQQKKPAIAKAAQERADALKGKLLYLTIKVEARVAGLVVRRGEETVVEASYDSRLPVDPGKWLIRAEAPDHEPFSAEINLQDGKPDNTVTIPALKKKGTSPAPTSSSSAPPPPPSASSAPGTSTAPPTATGTAVAPRSSLTGYVLIGAGAVALGIGSYMGLSSMADYRTAKRECPTRLECNKAALDARDRAEAKAWGSNVGVGLGVVGLAIGGYLAFFSGNEAKTSAVRVGGSVARDGAGLQLSGGF